MAMLKKWFTLVLLTGISGAVLAQSAGEIRLYVLDGGELEASPSSYNLRDDEVGSTLLALSSFLIVHPQGVLLWEAGAVPDQERVMEGVGARQIVIRSDEAERPVHLGPSLTSQLEAIGYAPADVTHLALSHFHWDHSANANTFAHATWLVRPEERAAMFPDEPLHNSARPMTYAALRSANRIDITDEEYDVFDDGKVILKAARGHSPGHQVLYVELAETGGVVLSGDLYHYPEERTLDRLPRSDWDVAQTQEARVAVEEFLARKNAALWIEHDMLAHRALKKAPAFYR
jgi:N-acyl homoserine lactone hydrolase